MELPPQIPDKRQSERKRREIKKLYDEIGNDVVFQQTLVEAQQFASNHGAMPDTTVGMYMINLCLQNNLKEIAEESMQAAQQFSQSVEGADPDAGGQQNGGQAPVEQAAQQSGGNGNGGANVQGDDVPVGVDTDDLGS